MGGEQSCLPCDADLLLLALFPEQPALTTGLGVLVVAHHKQEAASPRLGHLSLAPRYWLWGTRGRKIISSPAEVRKGPPAPSQKAGNQPPPGIKKVGIGVTYTLALGEDGNLVAWGRDRHGCLGIGKSISGRPKRRCFGPPMAVPFAQAPGSVADPVIDIVLGARHVLALTGAGRVFSWGGNQYGQLGVGDATARCQPALVGFPETEAVRQILAVEDGSYALAARGVVFAWGDNRGGTLGLGKPPTCSSPNVTPATKEFYPTPNELVLRPEEMKSLSKNSPPVRRIESQFGYSRGSCGWLPGAIVAYTEPSAGAALAEALEGSADEDKFLMDFWLWGLWGTRRVELPFRPYAARKRGDSRRASAKMVRVAVAARHFHVLWEDGAISVWGRSDHGCMGLGADAVASKATDIVFPDKDPEDPIVDVQHGRHHLLALTARGLVYAWGDNRFGQLGQGNAEQRSAPCLVKDLRERRCIQILAAGDSSYALTDEGVLHAWGDNSDGALAVVGKKPAHMQRSLEPEPVGLTGGAVSRLQVMPTPRPAARLVDHSQKRPLGW